MRLLWDVRYLSTGYKFRGIGVWATTMIESAYALKPLKTQIYLLGCKSDAPSHWHTWSVIWISYKPRNWKIDLLLLPIVARVYKIQYVHHWVVCGPLFQIGISFISHCKRIATVYDTGIEHWNEVAFLASRKKSIFWKMQKYSLKGCTTILTISKSVVCDVKSMIVKNPPSVQHVYVPMSQAPLLYDIQKREPMLLALGGSPTKNLLRVLRAFAKIRNENPFFILKVGGILEGDELRTMDCMPGVESVSMHEFTCALKHATALLVCSIHEGFGLPILSAFSCGCPLVVSDIPVLKEIVSDGGAYCDPHNVESIADAMQLVINNPMHWEGKSIQAAKQYNILSAHAAKSVWELYDTF